MQNKKMDENLKKKKRNFSPIAKKIDIERNRKSLIEKMRREKMRYKHQIDG